MMLRTAIALLAMLTPALAGMPPKEFQGPYDGELIVHKVPFGKAEAECSKIGRRLGISRLGRATYGCAFSQPGRCEIVISYDPTNQDRNMLSNTRGHEIGHCNGWPADHPNAI